MTTDPTHRPLADLINLDAFPPPPARRMHQRRFDEATEIQTLAREEAALGNTRPPVGIGVYQPIQKLDPAACGHVSTICRACRRHWEQDYFLSAFTHGTKNAYSNQGCRCPVCRASTYRKRPRNPAPE